jgi:geranylgeranyl transferase type-2 subunit alpha
MAQHGVRKEKSSEQKELEERQLDAQRIAKLSGLMARVDALKAADAFTRADLALCTDVLELCGEYYTVWNLRKRVLLALFSDGTSSSAAPVAPDAAPDAAAAAGGGGATNDSSVPPGTAVGAPSGADVFASELKFGKHAIARSPKSYWCWAHRKWLFDVGLARVSPPVVPDWETELKLCAQLLDLDQRNFHCWSYRRFVVARRGGEHGATELQFTRQKIDQNFSNYSAWHQRSLLLTQMHTPGAALTAALASEFALIQQAYYTEPDDQSAWVYHRWLVCKTLETETRDVICATLRSELANCNELLAVEPTSKWALLTSVFLTRQLLAQRESGVAEHERAALVSTALSRLDLLQRVDAMRVLFYAQEKQHFEL